MRFVRPLCGLFSPIFWAAPKDWAPEGYVAGGYLRYECLSLYGGAFDRSVSCASGITGVRYPLRPFGAPLPVAVPGKSIASYFGSYFPTAATRSPALNPPLAALGSLPKGRGKWGAVIPHLTPPSRLRRHLLLKEKAWCSAGSGCVPAGDQWSPLRTRIGGASANQ